MKVAFNGSKQAQTQSGLRELHLVDMSALGRSAWHNTAFARFAVSMPDGSIMKTNAMYGILQVFKTLKGFVFEENSNIDIVFCADRRSARKDEFEGYKAGRIKPENPYFEQMAAMENLLEKSNFAVFYQDGYEADDMIATVVANIGYQYDKVIIHTNDGDMFQLIDETVLVRRPSKADVTVDSFEAAAGYPFNLTTIYKSIVGDGSDKLPGVRGIGPATFLSSYMPKIIALGYDIASISKENIEATVLDKLFADDSDKLAQAQKMLSLVKLRIAEIPVAEAFDITRPDKVEFVNFMQLYKMNSIIKAI